MTKHYQILRKPQGLPKGTRAKWSFVAHGAVYDEAQAAATVAAIESHTGDKTKLLRV